MNDKIRMEIIKKEIAMCDRFIQIAFVIKEITTKFDGKIVSDIFCDAIDFSLNQENRSKKTCRVSIGYGHSNAFVITVFYEDSYVEIKEFKETGHSACYPIRNTLYDYIFPKDIFIITKEQNYRINANKMNEYIDTTIIPILRNKLEYWEEQLEKICI